MSLPARTRLWQIRPNIPFTTSGNARTDQQAVLRGIVTALLAMTTAAPTIVGSSNGATAGLDAVFRWGSSAQVVFAAAGVAHSWIVIAMPGIASGFQFCIDCVTTGSPGDTFLQLSVSYSAGFTGGSITARPTASDELVCSDPTVNGGLIAWLASGLVTVDRSLNVWWSNDGAAFRVAIYADGVCDSWWQIERPVNVVPGWTKAFVAGVLGDAPTFDTMCRPDGPLWGLGQDLPMQMGLSTEACGALAIGQRMTQANGLSGNFPMTFCGLFSNTTATRDAAPIYIGGRHGKIVDMEFGSVTPVEGTTYPDDASRQWIQIGCTIQPWDGSA